MNKTKKRTPYPERYGVLFIETNLFHEDVVFAEGASKALQKCGGEFDAVFREDGLSGVGKAKEHLGFAGALG